MPQKQGGLLQGFHVATKFWRIERTVDFPFAMERTPWHFSTATLLHSGKVLIVGGYGNNDASTAWAWVYSP